MLFLFALNSSSTIFSLQFFSTPMAGQSEPWYPPFPGIADNVQTWVRNLYSFDNGSPDIEELGYFCRFAPQANTQYHGDVLRRSQSFNFRYAAFFDHNLPNLSVDPPTRCHSSHVFFVIRCMAIILELCASPLCVTTNHSTLPDMK